VTVLVSVNLLIQQLTARLQLELCLLGYHALQSVGSRLMFRRDTSPPPSGSKTSQARSQHEVACKKSRADSLLDLFVDPEDGGEVFTLNVG
jgi:hypothetical protein